MTSETNSDHDVKPQPVSQQRENITVCICTYKRPKMLSFLLKKLNEQKTNDLFTYSAVVVDNDASRSAEAIIEMFKEVSEMDVKYVCEPVRNIALARNATVGNAAADYMAFIDDDEFPSEEWLLALYSACIHYRADGVLGPVRPSFEGVAPKWIVKGRFYEKGTHSSGHVLGWQDTRMSNALIKGSIFAKAENLFRAEFGRGGEDMDFFQRAIDKRYLFVWCDEAPVWETIPRERLTKGYMLRRALLRGMMTLKYSNFGRTHIAKSIVAVPVYTLSLPFALALGQHRFMMIAAKLFEHIGRLAALLGLDVIGEYYVTK